MKPSASIETLDPQKVDGAFDGSFAGIAKEGPKSAVPWFRRREYYTEGWTDPVIWRSMIVECVAVACMFFVSGQFGITLMSYGTNQVSAYVGIFNAILLALFIYATAAATGGHVNPMISFATMLCGFTPVSRATLLIVAQTAGGALAGGLLRGSWGRELALASMGGGNIYDPSTISTGQVLLIEIMSSLSVLYLAIGTAIDPRSQMVFGHQGPMLVGMSLGLVAAATTGIIPGYTGANMNPSRAMALSVAGSNWKGHWIWWVGPAIAGMIIALVYGFVPPFHAEKAEKPQPVNREKDEESA